MRNRALLMLALLGAPFALPAALSPAFAQEQSEAAEEEQAAPVLLPPELLEFVEAQYPEGAATDGQEAAVEMAITIGVDGSVTDAEVLVSAGQAFDEAALDAVRRFVFRPATRDGEPIPSRVGYRYVFEFQEPELPPEPEAPLPGMLEGQILDQGDGRAIARATVLLESEDGAIQREVIADEEGRFSFPELPAGSYLLQISADEMGGAEGLEEIRAGEATTVTYRLAGSAEEDEGTQYSFGATGVVERPPREVTRRTIGREELTRIPGTRGDALRAVELLPGVARPPFGSGNLIIRGSSPRDSQTFIEGVPVPLLYHFGGLTSIINSRLLEQIDFYPGNFSARYGRKLGGIVEVGLRDPRNDGIHGVAELSAIDASLLAEFSLGDNLSGAFGFRRSTIDFVFNQVVPDSIGVTAAPVYYDYQGFLTWRPSERDRVRFFAYGASDRFEIVADDALGDNAEIRGDIGLTTRFTVLNLEWERKVDADTDFDVSLAWNPTNLNFGVGDFINFDLELHQITGRAEVRHRATRGVRLIAGVDLNMGPYELNYTGPAPRTSEGDGVQGPTNIEIGDPIRESGFVTRPAFYFESDMQLAEPWKVIMGLRLDYDGQTEEFSFDPRLVTLLSVTPSLRLKAGVGLFSQPPEFQESSATLGNPNLETLRSVHTSAGFEYDIAPGIEVGVDGFYKYLWDRVIGTEGGLAPRFTNGGIGRIYGAEISGRITPIEGRKFFGYLSYTLMRSERRDREGGPWRLFDFDQTHILTLSMVYKLPKNWEIGGTFRLVSGNPTTPISNRGFNANNGGYFPLNGPINSIRNPYFHRLDLRVEKQWHFDSWKLALFLDIQNVYNRQNQENLAWRFDFRNNIPISGLPIIPAIGIRGEL